MMSLRGEGEQTLGLMVEKLWRRRSFREREMVSVLGKTEKFPYLKCSKGVVQ